MSQINIEVVVVPTPPTAEFEAEIARIQAERHRLAMHDDDDWVPDPPDDPA